MDFLNTILSIVPSIAGVIGQLFGANDNDYLKLSMRLPNSNTNEDEDDDIYFVKEKDNIIACNSSKDTVQISFPAENGAKGVSYGLKYCSRWPITTPITDHAKANVDQFEITRGGNVKPSTDALDCAAVITVSGKIDKREIHFQDLGGDLSVMASGDDLVVRTTAIYTLDSIKLLIISGEGNEPTRKYQNVGKSVAALAKSGVDEEKNEIRIPNALASFIYSNYVYLNLSASCSYDSNSENLLKMESDLGIRLMKDEDWDFLKKGKCLNA